VQSAKKISREASRSARAERGDFTVSVSCALHGAM
jgi:hypothetical protein